MAMGSSGPQAAQQGGKTTPAAGATVKEDFGSTELLVQAETNSAALAARSQAMVQAAFVMAERHPRDWDDVRVRLIRECQRPGFARAARYSKPVGNGRVEGPSIRFAEAALRLMRNVVVDQSIVRDDQTRRTIEVVIIDAEANVRFTRQVSIDKTVERSYVKDGQVALSQRVNTHGKPTYLIAASEDELANKQAAAVSKALRTEGLRLLPGDILEECMDECVTTQRKKDAADPDQARKDISDAFARLNITPAMLKIYLDHDLATVSPAEMTDLRGIYEAIRDGETTWRAVMDERGGDAGGPKAPVAPSAPPAPPVAAPAPTPTAAPTQTASTATAATVDAPPQAAQPEPAPPASAQTVDAAPPTTPDVAPPAAGPAPNEWSPAERALAEKLTAAQAKKEVFALVKTVTSLPAERQAFWRQRCTERLAELQK